jgi:hypothetical protein
METSASVRALPWHSGESNRVAGEFDIRLLFEGVMRMCVPVTEKMRTTQEQWAIISGDPRELVYVPGLIEPLLFPSEHLPAPPYAQMLGQACDAIADGLTCRVPTGSST